jgi:hypothetical protein
MLALELAQDTTNAESNHEAKKGKGVEAAQEIDVAMKEDN